MYCRCLITHPLFSLAIGFKWCIPLTLAPAPFKSAILHTQTCKIYFTKHAGIKTAYKAKKDRKIQEGGDTDSNEHFSQCLKPCFCRIVLNTTVTTWTYIQSHMSSAGLQQQISKCFRT